MKRKITIIVAITLLFSCKERREIKYSGFNDLMVGSHTINLFENGEFNIELGLGYESGSYEIKRDTIILTYEPGSKRANKLLLTTEEIIVLDHKRLIKIDRTDNIKSRLTSSAN